MNDHSFLELPDPPARELPFPPAEFERRVERTRTAMADRGLDLLLLYAPEDIYYVTGFDSPGYYAYQFAALPLEGDAVLYIQSVERAIAADTTWVEDVRTYRYHGGLDVCNAATAAIVRELVGDDATVGYPGRLNYFRAETYRALTRDLPRTSFEDSSMIVADMRVVKSELELEHVRRAGRLADRGMSTALEALREGATENEVAAATYHALYSAGSSYAAMPLLISSGPNTAYGHGTATDRALAAGDAVTLELGGVSARYNVNLLRTAAVGRAPDRIRELHAILHEAVLAATEAVAPGVPVAEIDRITRRVTRDHDHLRLHRTGYGLDAGYPPAWMGVLSIDEQDPHVLEPGMVFSIEPTFLDAESRVGVVLGDQIAVTADGHEVLTKTTLDLCVR